MKFKRVKLTLLGLSLLINGCSSTNPKVRFTYNTTPFSDTIGAKRNHENYRYNDLIVNPVPNLRSDFAMGVDGSMIETVLKNGGVYFNEQGQEQDVYQIMARNGVNFFRVRVWNNPENLFGDGYGGGNVDTTKAIKMAKGAAAANMNIMVDLHYSDFWADPGDQRIPTAWAGKSLSELAKAVQDYTAEVLRAFKDAGVNVAAVQIGNEINNGLLFPVGQINWANPAQSYADVATILKAGIKGAKSVNKKILTMIHLAEGGSYDLFNNFFSAMDKNKVNYDLIGASYYPFYHGSLANLKNNLDNTAAKFKKPVIVAETSYGFTTDYNEYTENIYNANMEDAGSYKTSIQAQATALRDVIEVLAEVPENRGLGVFYWEPAWLPVPNAGWATAQGQAWLATGDGTSSANVSKYTDGKVTWANQALFSYEGRMLPSLKTFNLVRGAQSTVNEVATKVRHSTISLTLNIAANEKLPATYLVETNFDAIRPFSVAWNESESAALTSPGNYRVSGLVAGSFPVTASVKVIQNYVLDSSFEDQGSSDRVILPWVAESDTHPSNVNRVAKLNRKAGDVRTGTTTFNWYDSSDLFHFRLSQAITISEAGTYELSAYLMGSAMSEFKIHQLEIFVIRGDGTRLVVDMKNVIKGWASGYHKGEITNLRLNSGEHIKIGLEGRFNAKAWGHADDFTMVKVG